MKLIQPSIYFRKTRYHSFSFCYIRPFQRAVAVFLLCLFASPVSAETVRVIDGDGLRLDGVSVRLWGIDAPELRQTCQQSGNLYPCGERARDALQAALRDSVPRCERVSGDRYGRTVARCFVGDDDLAAIMVRQGWAVDYPRYSKGAYASEQDAASDAGRGLWVEVTALLARLAQFRRIYAP